MSLLNRGALRRVGRAPYARVVDRSELWRSTFRGLHVPSSILSIRIVRESLATNEPNEIGRYDFPNPAQSSIDLAIEGDHLIATRADGLNEPSSRGELLGEWLRDLGESRRHQDRIEGRRLGYSE